MSTTDPTEGIFELVRKLRERPHQQEDVDTAASKLEDLAIAYSILFHRLGDYRATLRRIRDLLGGVLLRDSEAVDRVDFSVPHSDGTCGDLAPEAVDAVMQTLDED